MPALCMQWKAEWQNPVKTLGMLEYRSWFWDQNISYCVLSTNSFIRFWQGFWILENQTHANVEKRSTVESLITDTSLLRPQCMGFWRVLERDSKVSRWPAIPLQVYFSSWFPGGSFTGKKKAAEWKLKLSEYVKYSLAKESMVSSLSLLLQLEVDLPHFCLPFPQETLAYSHHFKFVLRCSKTSRT